MLAIAALRACLATALLASVSCWTQGAHAFGTSQTSGLLRAAPAQRAPRLVRLRRAEMVQTPVRSEAAAPAWMSSPPSTVEDVISDALAARSRSCRLV
jgi:hypothetical protein